jgi:hypothetical protein
MTTLNDFFGSSNEATPECSFCGGTEGELIVSVSDAYGPTHWHHQACKDDDDDSKGSQVMPTWDEAMDDPEIDPKVAHQIQAPPRMSIADLSYWYGRASELLGYPATINFEV